MSNLHNLLKAKQALEVAWRAVDDAIAAESIPAAPQYDEPEQWIDTDAAYHLLSGRKAKRTLQRLWENQDAKDAGVIKRGEPSRASPPYPVTALTTPDTDQEDQDDNAPERIKPVGVDGWPLPDTDTGGVDQIEKPIGGEARSGPTSHASANQALGGSDA